MSQPLRTTSSESTGPPAHARTSAGWARGYANMVALQLVLLLFAATAAPELSASTPQDRFQLGLLGCRDEDAHALTPRGWRLPTDNDARLVQVDQGGDAPFCLTVDTLSLSALGPNVVAGADLMVATCSHDSAVNATAATATQDPQGWAVLSGGLVRSLMAPDLCIGKGLDLVACNNSHTVGVWVQPAGTRKLQLAHGVSPTWAACIGSIRTVCSGQHSCLNCSTIPGRKMPYCNSSLSVSDRVANVLTFLGTKEVTRTNGNVLRLGLPKAPTGECLHGFVTNCGPNTTDHTDCTTVFPAGLTSAAAFNETLFEAIGTAISTEGRAFSNQNYLGDKPHSICWAPDLNPFRHPAWGRGQEVPGEDPFLAARYGVGYVKGLQGVDDPLGNGFLRAVASPKHFVGYDLEYSTVNGTTWMRHNFTVKTTSQEMVEYFLLPFEQVVSESGALGLMCSYNAVDVDGRGSTPACAMGSLQNQLVRDRWGFTGNIVSDCGALEDFLPYGHCSGCDDRNNTPPGSFLHNFTDEETYAAALGMLGGTNSNCGGTYGQVPQALAAGAISKADVVASMAGVLRSIFATGAANAVDEQPYASLGIDDIDTVAHRQLALEAAQQGTVLLKNRGILPIKPGTTIAPIGPHSSATLSMLSNYHGDRPQSLITCPIDALRSRGATIANNVSCNWHDDPYLSPPVVGVEGTCWRGAGPAPTTSKMIDMAAAYAKTADVAVVFVGLSNCNENEMIDRHYGRDNGLKLPNGQDALVEAVFKANPQTVVVLIHGGAIAIDWSAQHIPAIVDAHYPGEMGGYAIADVLLGLYNPDGRNPTTIYPAMFAQRSIFDTQLRSDGGLTYLHYDGKYGPPLFPFAHGLSYSSFAVVPAAKDIVVDTTTLQSVGHHSLVFTVTNVAGPAGAYSLPCFIQSGHQQAPRHKLVGFTKTHVLAASGGSETVTVNATATMLSLVNSDGSRWLQPGAYSISTEVDGSTAIALRITGAPIEISPALPAQPPKPYFPPLVPGPHPPHPGPSPPPHGEPYPVGPTPGCRTINGSQVYLPRDKKLVGVRTAQDCCSLCVNQTGCTAYSWEEYNSFTNGKCWLTSGTPAPPRPCDGKAPCCSGVPTSG